MNKCIGIMGWLFGHKYVKVGWQSNITHCYRCGHRP